MGENTALKLLLWMRAAHDTLRMRYPPRAHHDPVHGEQVIELTHMHMQTLAIFRAAIGVVRPHETAQFPSRNVWVALHGVVNSRLDRSPAPEARSAGRKSGTV